MVLILSPSKTMGKIEDGTFQTQLIPQYTKEANQLVKIIKKLSTNDLIHWMKISENIAIQVKQMYSTFAKYEAHPALFSYTGEVYNGLQPKEFNQEDLAYAANHFRILSGLYGVLRPLDGINPYRLEMALKVSHPTFGSLVNFWKSKITKEINQTLQQSNSQLLLNLASLEYSKTIDQKKLKAKFVDVEFYEIRSGKKTFVSFSAKRARGLLAHYVIKNKVRTIEELQKFTVEDYFYVDIESTETSLVFHKIV